MYVHIYIYIYIYIHIYICVGYALTPRAAAQRPQQAARDVMCLYIYMHICLHTQRTQTCALHVLAHSAHTNTHAHTHVQDVYEYLKPLPINYRKLRAISCVYIHISTYIFLNTHMHTNTHMRRVCINTWNRC